MDNQRGCKEKVDPHLNEKICVIILATEWHRVYFSISRQYKNVSMINFHLKLILVRNYSCLRRHAGNFPKITPRSFFFLGPAKFESHV